MTIEQLRALHRAVPFRPFRLKMAHGGWISVPHPEFLMMSPGGGRIEVVNPDDSVSRLLLAFVTGVEVAPARSPKS